MKFYMASPFFVTVMASFHFCAKSEQLNYYKNTEYAPTNLYKKGYYWIIINTLFMNGGFTKVYKYYG